MYTLTAAQFANAATGEVDQSLVDALFALLGQCDAPITHRGPVWLQGPDTTGMPNVVIADPSLTKNESIVQNAVNLMVQPLTFLQQNAINLTQNEINLQFDNSPFALIVGNPPDPYPNITVNPPTYGYNPNYTYNPPYTITYVPPVTYTVGTPPNDYIITTKDPSYYYTLPPITTYFPGITYMPTIIYDRIIPSSKGSGEVWCETEMDVVTGVTGSFNRSDCTFSLTVSKTKVRVQSKCTDPIMGVDTAPVNTGSGQNGPYTPGGPYVDPNGGFIPPSGPFAVDPPDYQSANIDYLMYYFGGPDSAPYYP